MKQSIKFTFAMICIVVLAVAAIVGLAAYQETLSGDEYLGTDVFKLLFQFFLLLVLGGAISAVYKEFSNEREAAREAQERLRIRAELRREANNALSMQLIEIYNNAKRIRRLLRARALRHEGKRALNDSTTNTVVVVDEYDKLMEELNEVQLSFETQKRLAAVDLSLLEAIPDILDNLGSVEKYLNRIVREYEESLPTFEGGIVDLVFAV